MSRPPLIAAFFSATNFFALGAAALSLSVGSLPSAILFTLVMLAGTANKCSSLLDKGWVQKNILLKPELTATTLMLASLLNTIHQILIYIFSETSISSIPFLAPSFPSPSVHLLLACAWGSGLIGEYFLKIHDRHYFKALKTNTPFSGFWIALSNPSLWYSIPNIIITIVTFHFNDAQNISLLQYLFGGLSVLASLIGIFTSSYNAFHQKKHNNFVSACTAFANAMMAIQALCGILSPIAIFMFIAQLLFMVGNGLSYYEMKERSKL